MKIDSNSTIINKNGELGQSWQTDLQTGNLLVVFGNNMTQLLIPFSILTWETNLSNQKIAVTPIKIDTPLYRMPYKNP